MFFLWNYSINEQYFNYLLTAERMASLCDMPQSSIARIKLMQITQKLDTLLKIMRSLGLDLTVTPIK